jgi:hypothetical protein
MPTSDYYRRQAETCLKLALTVGDSSREVATYLNAMAQEFMLKAASARAELKFGAVEGGLFRSRDDREMSRD